MPNRNLTPDELKRANELLRVNATLSKACRGFALFLEGRNFALSDGDHGFTPRLSVQLQSNSRGWLHRMFPCKRHQMRHLCDLACLLAKQVLPRTFWYSGV